MVFKKKTAFLCVTDIEDRWAFRCKSRYNRLLLCESLFIMYIPKFFQNQSLFVVKFKLILITVWHWAEAITTRASAVGDALPFDSPFAKYRKAQLFRKKKKQRLIENESNRMTHLGSLVGGDVNVGYCEPNAAKSLRYISSQNNIKIELARFPNSLHEFDFASGIAADACYVVECLAQQRIPIAHMLLTRILTIKKICINIKFSLTLLLHMNAQVGKST